MRHGRDAPGNEPKLLVAHILAVGPLLLQGVVFSVYLSYLILYLLQLLLLEVPVNAVLCGFALV